MHDQITIPIPAALHTVLFGPFSPKDIISAVGIKSNPGGGTQSFGNSIQALIERHIGLHLILPVFRIACLGRQYPGIGFVPCSVGRH